MRCLEYELVDTFLICSSSGLIISTSSGFWSGAMLLRMRWRT